MRLTKAGTRNKQDWSTLDHLQAGHAPVAPPLTLALSLIGGSAVSLERAAKALRQIDDPYLAATLAQMVKTLDTVVVTLKTRETV